MSSAASCGFEVDTKKEIEYKVTHWIHVVQIHFLFGSYVNSSQTIRNITRFSLETISWS